MGVADCGHVHGGQWRGAGEEREAWAGDGCGYIGDCFIKKRGAHDILSYGTHVLGSAVVLHLWASRTADMPMAANGEAQERSARRGLLVYSAWPVGSQPPWGT